MLTSLFSVWLVIDSAWLLGFRLVFADGRPTWWRSSGGLLAVAMAFIHARSDVTGLFFLVTIYAFISTITATVQSVARRQGAAGGGVAAQASPSSPTTAAAAVAQPVIPGVQELTKLVSENAKLKEQLRLNNDHHTNMSNEKSDEVSRMLRRAEKAEEALEVAEKERDTSYEDCQRLRTTLSRFRRQQRVLSNAYQEKDEEHKQLQESIDTLNSSSIHEHHDDHAEEKQDREALAALRVMTATVDDQTRQLSELTTQMNDKERQLGALMNQLNAAEIARDDALGQLASMDEVRQDYKNIKAERDELVDECHELKTLLEVSKRQALEADQNRQLAGYAPATPSGGNTPSGGADSLTKKQREDMILARVRQSPAYKAP